MPGFELETTVDAPAERVFAHATDLDRVRTWLPDITHVERVDDGPLRAGSSYRETRQVGRRRATATIHVVELEGPAQRPGPPYRYAASAAMLGVECVYRYTFEPAGEGRCRVRMDATATPRSLLGRLFAGAFARAMSKSDGDQLERLRAAVEAG